MGARMESAVVRAAAGLSALAVLFVYQTTAFWYTDQLLLATLTGVLAVLLSVSCLGCVDILRLAPADSHSFRTLLAQYFYILNTRLKSAKALRQFYQDICDCSKAQETQLVEIIRKNENTAYGRDKSFCAIRCVDDFRRLHPLTTYTDYEEYISRAERGEPNILTSDKVQFFATSSGRSGRVKTYPYTAEYCNKLVGAVVDLYRACSLHMLNMKRVHSFNLHSPVEVTEDGNIPYDVGGNYLTPPPSYNIVPDHYTRIYEEDTSYYIQALFSLAEKELHLIQGLSSHLMYSFFKFMDDHHKDLCRDIRKGEIAKTLPLDSDIRRHLQVSLRANPARARILEHHFAKGPVGLAKRIWHDLEFVTIEKSAGFALSATILEHSYLQGVKITGTGHGAAEGFLGLVLENEPSVGEVMTMIPRPCFWEFIPVEQVDLKDPQTFLMHELKADKLYELVSTNENGLYRCRVGDIIKVIGFAKSTPKYEFQYSLGQRLNVCSEQTPENAVYGALEVGSSNWPPDVTLIDYTTTESFFIDQLTGKRSAAHYVFFIEISGEYANKHIFTTTHEKQIDEALCDLWGVYRKQRAGAQRTIGPPSIVQVKAGTFNELKRHLWGKHANAQFKMPRVLRNVDEIDFLLKKQLQPLGTNGSNN